MYLTAHFKMARAGSGSGSRLFLSSRCPPVASPAIQACKMCQRSYVGHFNKAAGAGVKARRNFLAHSTPNLQSDAVPPDGHQVSGNSNPLKYFLVAITVLSVVLYTIGSGQGLKVAGKNPIASQSGFVAAFSLIFLSEIGDKTFFIAGLLAARVGRWRSLVGSTAALTLMTIISVTIGSAFKSLPDVLRSSLPIGQYLGAFLMLLFGIRTLMEAWRSPNEPGEGAEDGELHEAELSISSAESKGQMTTQKQTWRTLLQVASLIFLAEWGDRSMLATIALGASHPPVGVAVGASIAHAAATGIAVLGGAFLSKHVTERTIGLTGGSLFLFFAVLTFFGYF